MLTDWNMASLYTKVSAAREHCTCRVLSHHVSRKRCSAAVLTDWNMASLYTKVSAAREHVHMPGTFPPS